MRRCEGQFGRYHRPGSRDRPEWDGPCLAHHGAEVFRFSTISLTCCRGYVSVELLTPMAALEVGTRRDIRHRTSAGNYDSANEIWHTDEDTPTMIVFCMGHPLIYGDEYLDL